VGVNGATVTTANSGGQVAGGYDDPFNLFSNNIPTFDNAHAHHGALALKFTQPSGSANPPGMPSFARVYLFITASPSQAVQLIRFSDAAGVLIGGVRLTATGTLICLKANNAIVGSASAALPLNAWIRVEARCLPSTVSGVGEIECRIWSTNAESTGAADTTLNNTGVASLGGNTIDRFEWGIAANPAAFTVTWNLWVDDVVGNATTWPGPAIVSGAIINIGVADNAFSSAGLFPSATLKPSSSLFPASGGTGMTDAVAAVKISGGATFNRAASDTGVTVTDTVATLRARVLSDTGVTVTDSVATLRLHQKADTGTTVSDSVATNRTRVVADTGTTTSDSVVGGRGFARAITDTGATNTDTVATLRVHLVADTGATNTDSVATIRVRVLADTATTMSDSVVGGRGFARAVADTGVTVTDATATLRVHLVSDTGVAVSDQLARRIGRVITDTGLTLSDTPALRLVHLIGVSDTGLTLSDSVVAVSGQSRALSGLYGVVGKVDSSGLVNVGSATGIVQL
jgi:hypothetical protein